MKDPRTALQTAFYGLLDNAITYNSHTVAVSDIMYPPDSFPHVLLGDWTIRDDSDKAYFMQICSFTVRIYDRMSGNMGSRAAMYDIANQVIGIIRSRPDSVIPQGFHLIWLRLDNENLLPKVQTDTFIQFGTLLRFELEVQQTERTDR
jgi:hypothetical protein